MAEYNVWFKSSLSGANGACVEVMFEKVGLDPLVVHVRNSNDPDGPVVKFTSAEWTAFNSASSEFALPS